MTRIPSAARARPAANCPAANCAADGGRDHAPLSGRQGRGAGLSPGRLPHVRRAPPATEGAGLACSRLAWPDRAAGHGSVPHGPRMTRGKMPSDGKPHGWGAVGPLAQV